MNNSDRKAEAGYLYVLTHPSDPELYKVGKTNRHPNERLAEHNSRFDTVAGRIVKDTGLKWTLMTFFSVPDTYWAEAVFWGATGLPDIPFRYGVEVAKLNKTILDEGLAAVQKAGLRPPPRATLDHVYAYGAWMKKRLVGRGIKLLSQVRSKTGKSDFSCENDHQWRATPLKVAKGQGCPICGIGEKSYKEINESIDVGVIYLLKNPQMPGFYKIATTKGEFEFNKQHNFDAGWEFHRYQNTEEIELSQKLFLEMLGFPNHEITEPFKLEEEFVEKKFSDLHYRLVQEIALLEKAKEVSEMVKNNN